jgi:hypothetical protein
VKKEEFFNAEVSKIGCIARDFKHVTRGLWRHSGHPGAPYFHHRAYG